MVNRNYFLTTVLLWLLLCYHNLCISAQSQNAIGAYRTFQKTSFSCSGRPSGYYADIETGCQVYHMCDGLGRQFSYSCPNTTLFQQRMLICDHWYMVNCSKAESDYTANLLIGQRDKPFVNDEENSLRTPRPDLLDRPYAPDYSGESFRNQYQKSLSSVLNQIYDNAAQKNKDKSSQANQNQQGIGQQRWKIPPPSRVILPPAYDPQAPEESSARPSTRVSYYTPVTTTTTRKPSTLRPTLSSRTQTTKFNSVAALHNRQDDHLQFDNDDLGTSHSTRYNTSADFNSAEDRFAKTPIKSTTQRKPTFNTNYNNAFTTAKPAASTRKATTSSNPKVKVPSKIYEPPVLYPIYNSDDGTPTNTTTPRPTYRQSTASPFVTRLTATTSTTTTKAPTRPTTVGGKPFTRSSSLSTTTQVSPNQNDVSRFDVTKLSKEIRTPAPAQGFKSPTPRPSARNATTVTPSRGNVQHEQPSKHLLPPFTDFITHDVATTQGPPIYYEWKVPSDGLEPPKLDSPIGVDGREYPESSIDYNSISTNNGLTSISTFGIDQTNTPSNSTSRRLETKPTIPSRSPAARSVKETAQPNSMTQTRTKASSTTKTTNPQPSSSSPGDIYQMGKDLSVPEYAFPLDNDARTGYLDTDVYNSFLLKYPERRTDQDQNLHWYGENPKCPECHPSYVIPGTCEPCLRR